MRAELVQDAPDGHWVGEQPRGLAHAPVRVDGLEIPRVQEGVPVGHVHHGLLQLRAGVLELGEEPAGPQVVVVLVDLPQGVAYLEVGLVVGHPVLLAAVYRHAAVRALEVDVRWGQLRGLGVLAQGRATLG